MMGDRDNNNLIPFVAGMVVGAGLLTLLYKMFFSGPSKEKAKPATVSCEEKERRARERARRAAARGYGGGGGYGPGGGGGYGPGGGGGYGPGGGGYGPDGGGYGPDGPDGGWEGRGWPRREPPPPRFSPVQIVLGSTGFLFALLALFFKTVDNDRAHSILSTVGLGHLVPKKVVRTRSGAHCITQKKRRWPREDKQQKEE